MLFGICALGAMADLAIYYIRETSFGLVFTVLAFLIYIVVVGFQIAFDYYKKENELLEKEVELAESRIDLMVSKIQPHFLYNVITSIMAICMQNADKAVSALADFADYLRGNLDSLQNEKMISFSKELHHIESYMRLEKLRFADKLNIEYDIEVRNFLIPTLTVQPLMENAVKHGVGQKEDGGTVRLITRELGDHILIIVEDTGVGFNPEKQKNDGRTHLGLENVKRRISVMSKGEMLIESVKGEGTTISLELPKKL
jgi:LytS/YehU family sensor histidine kinase